MDAQLSLRRSVEVLGRIGACLELARSRRALELIDPLADEA